MKYLKSYEDKNHDRIITIKDYRKIFFETPTIISMSEDSINIVINIDFIEMRISAKHFINKLSINNMHKIMVKLKFETSPKFFGYISDDDFEKLKGLELELSTNKYNL